MIDRRDASRTSVLCAAVGLLLLGALLLAGCGSGGSSSGVSESSSTSSNSAAGPTATAGAGKAAPESPLVKEAGVRPPKRSVTKSGSTVGQEPDLTKPEERAESKPSALFGETPTSSWPYFGRLPQRTHYLGGPIADLDPPFKVLWHINTHALIEFPPAIFGGVAYLVNKYGNVYAIRLSDKKILWRRIVRKRLHGAPIDVTGPAYSAGRVFVAEIGGALIALNAKTGKVDWKRNLNAHLESSPLIVGKTLYIGTDSSQVLAIDTTDGHEIWEYKAGASIKASPSFHEGLIYVGNYQAGMLALTAKSGKLVWQTNTSTQAPFGKGGFYSSPAIAFGHVYAARDDGVVFAFSRKTGKIAWSFPTGGAVYGSPAVAKVPGTPPTVYIGSENGRLFALDARDGKERWHQDVGGPIPGTASVIGNTVFSSSFETRESVGYDVHTHKRDFTLHSAGYSPVVSDGHRLYVAGYYTFYGLEDIPPK
ncbi:MAG: PQQ-binding-like beta-propeller repeat protein [Solirubrobacterales bacterium]|nr:PQQ-binding-like beta-propeller repeat protein [Solirubrobacterales bacterium]